MSLEVSFHRAAKTELIEASSWYENKQHGLVAEFILEIERCITFASNHATGCVLVKPDIRRVVAKRFPYSIYFRAEKTRIVVLAVFHSRRDPIIWMTRN